MQILFPNENPEYSGRELTLAFPALVDGQRVECMITAEALEDHFGAASPRLEDMVGAFDTHRERIEAATRRLLSETSAQCRRAAQRLHVPFMKRTGVPERIGTPRFARTYSLPR